MITIRCTAKLLARIGTKPAGEGATSSNLLGDWYATLARGGRQQAILAMASRTLLPIVMPARDARSFPARLVHELEDVLAVYGVPAAMIARELAEMAPATCAATNDRSLVGVLTELQRQLQYYLEDEPTLSLFEIGLRLAEIPIVARETIPDRATSVLFGVPLVRPPRRT